MKVTIIKNNYDGAGYAALSDPLLLGGVGTAGVAKLTFALPDEWKGMAVTLHIRQEGGEIPQPILLDAENSVTVDKRFTAARRGIWMLLAMNGAGYTAMTKPARYSCYETISLEATLEDIPQSVYEQFVKLVLEYANRAKDSERTAEANAIRSEAAADMAGVSEGQAREHANQTGQDLARMDAAAQIALRSANAAAASAARAGEAAQASDQSCIAAVQAANRAMATALPQSEKDLLLRLLENATYRAPEVRSLYEELAEAWKEVPVEEVQLSAGALELNVGQKAALAADVRPANATDQRLLWESSAPEIAAVEDGVVTALAKGGARLTVRAGGCSTDCAVLVRLAVERVDLNVNGLALTEGETATLAAAVSPADASDGTIVWGTSDPKIATVAGGVVTAVAAGAATITASAGGKSGICTVQVAAQVVPVESVTLSETTLTLKAGEAAQLSATVLPENATNQTVTWASDDRSVVTVGNGKVIALKEGSTTVTARADDAEGRCTVAVQATAAKVESIRLNQSTLTLTEGQSVQLTVSILPAQAAGEKVLWTSTDPDTVSVTDDGTLTAHKTGTAMISATAGGKTDNCTVTVEAAIVPVESIVLDRSALTLTEGGSAKLAATVKPDNATDKTVTWETSAEGVATVADGLVSAVTAGSARITARAGEKSAGCDVTVAAAIVYCSVVNKLSYVNTSNTGVVAQKGTAFTATLTPASGYKIASVVVTMGGENITSRVWNASTGKIQIGEVTGNVVITATAQIPLLSSVAEGSTVKMTENGTQVEFFVAKHNYEPGLNGSGRTLLVRKTPYKKVVWNTRWQTYKDSTVDQWLNGTYANVHTSAARNAMGETKFVYTHGRTGTGTGSGDMNTDTLSRKFFLLSVVEMGGPTDADASSYNNEGTKLPNAGAMAYVMSKSGQEPMYTRTPVNKLSDWGYSGSDVTNYQNESVCIGETHKVDIDAYIEAVRAGNAFNVCPAFTLPANTKVKTDGVVQL